MNPSERAEEREPRRRSRSKSAPLARTIRISLEGNLLKRADALAKKKGLNRSELIAGFVLAGLERRAV